MVTCYFSSMGKCHSGVHPVRKGCILQRRALIDAISKHFGEQLLLLSCKGLATVLAFRKRASQLVKLEDSADDDHRAIQTVAQLVRNSNCKRYPQNVRAFPLLAEELLRKHIEASDSNEEFDEMLDNASNHRSVITVR